MVGPLVKLAKVRGAELNRKGEKNEELERRGTSEQIYQAQHRAGRMGDSNTIPDTAGGEVVTVPLNRMP